MRNCYKRNLRTTSCLVDMVLFSLRFNEILIANETQFSTVLFKINFVHSTCGTRFSIFGHEREDFKHSMTSDIRARSIIMTRCNVKRHRWIIGKHEPKSTLFIDLQNNLQERVVMSIVEKKVNNGKLRNVMRRVCGIW